MLEILDAIEISAENVSAPLRLPIQDVYKFDARRIIAGRIESGSLKVGDTIKIFPEGRETKILEVASWRERDKKFSAQKGESVGIIIADEFFNKRGEIISTPDTPPQVSDRLRASIFWLGKNSLTVGKKYKLKLATAEVETTVEKIIRTIDAATLASQTNSEIKRCDVGEVILKLKERIAFDKFGDFAATGRFVLVEGYDVAGGGIILSDEKISVSGTAFEIGTRIIGAEIFDEFYYDVERRTITHVAETRDKVYKVGEKIPTKGFSYEYPADFDIILLNAAAFVKIRGEKISAVGELAIYKFEGVELINGRGFGIKVADAESFGQFLKEFDAVKDSGELARFSNKYFSLSRYRTLKFYFDYVI